MSDPFNWSVFPSSSCGPEGSHPPSATPSRPPEPHTQADAAAHKAVGERIIANRIFEGWIAGQEVISGIRHARHHGGS
jgi:hypothetical protein